MSIKEELSEELKDAMRAQDSRRRDVIRQIETEVSTAKTDPGRFTRAGSSSWAPFSSFWWFSSGSSWSPDRCGPCPGQRRLGGGEYSVDRFSPVRGRPFLMTDDPLTCPYCNARQPYRPGLVVGQKLACTRCGEAFVLRQLPAAPSGAITSTPPVAPPVKPRRSNRAVAAVVLGIMGIAGASGYHCSRHDCICSISALWLTMMSSARERISGCSARVSATWAMATAEAWCGIIISMNIRSNCPGMPAMSPVPIEGVPIIPVGAMAAAGVAAPATQGSVAAIWASGVPG